MAVAGALLFKGSEMLRRLILIAVVFTALLMLGCLYYTWWRLRLAGILLILAAIGLDVAMIPEPQEGMSRFLAGAGFGFLPFLVVGVLFLLSLWLSRKPSPSALPPSPTS